MARGDGKLQWSDVAPAVGKVIPALGALLGGPQGAVVGQVVAGWLGGEKTPQGLTQALLEPGAQERLATLYATQGHEIEMAILAATRAQAEQVNETIRAEVTSDDPYVRRARPGFVYALKWTWIGQVLSTWFASIFAIFADAFGDSVDSAEVLLQLAKLNADTTLLWGPALAVIGIYNYQRSRDKAVEAGFEPPSILDVLRRK